MENFFKDGNYFQRIKFFSKIKKIFIDRIFFQKWKFFLKMEKKFKDGKKI